MGLKYEYLETDGGHNWNNWHIHHAKRGGGQMLICTAGEGLYQLEGKKPVSLSEGSFLYIANGVKHWHGATNDSWFSHISVAIPSNGGCKEDFKIGDKVGVAGIGGLGHMAVKLAVSKGAEVYAFTTSPDKVKDIKDWGAKEVVVVDQAFKNMQPYNKKLHYMICTIPY